ncbi:glycine-rich domain-containing protein [Gottfriedia acidiceleris]|uniref:glycine-rich domain-containing protein n=1 Tax=Gottfriedia acidiceleris TaxID=371036 RepID=UPI0030002387
MKNFFERFFKKNLSNENAYYIDLYNQFITNDLKINSYFADLSFVSRLEKAWKMDFLANVKERVMEKEDWSNEKYSFIERELKRFFLMAAIFENVPMYSQEVDKIWHEMILFTKSYHNFCKAFCGEMIHHEPNVHKDGATIADRSDARAVYNLLYNTLFETTSVNTYVLGNLVVNYKNTKVQEYLSSKTIQTKSFVSHLNSQTKNNFLNEFARIQKNLVEKENEEERTKYQSQKSYQSSANRSASSKKSDDGHINSTFLATNSFFALNESSNDCSSKSDSHHHNSHSSCSSSSHSSCSSSHSSCSSSSCSSSGCSS